MIGIPTGQNRATEPGCAADTAGAASNLGRDLHRQSTTASPRFAGHSS